MNSSVTSSIATPFLLSHQSWQASASPSPARFRFGPALSSRRLLALKPPLRKRWRPPNLAARPQAFRVVEPSRGSKCCGEEAAAARVPEDSESSGRVTQCVVKPLACAVFFIAVGFAPFRRVQAPAAAAAAVAATELNLEKI
ncbi:hypothetical protein NL676_020494 [Syzygium grande]|nr:hypothetical protein NL676_020494 [Syzygium grande]